MSASRECGGAGPFRLLRASSRNELPVVSPAGGSCIAAPKPPHRSIQDDIANRR
jgi:hypothetical protein